ncbi:MAG: ISAzo13 family transposase [Patescibacteria group bacterium]
MLDDKLLIKTKYQALAPHLNERSRRIFAAVEAKALGYGGVSMVSKITRISRRAIHVGLVEIADSHALPPERIRAAGGGRKSALVKNPALCKIIEDMVEPVSRGDPMSSLRWTCKSTRALSKELRKQGHQVCAGVVAKLLRGMNYSLQGNLKTQEGKQHPDRNAQFEHINAEATTEMRRGNPVISVDTKKKELVGNYKNAGKQWLPQGEPVQVQGHDFPDPKVPRAHPYGIYDLAKNRGWVNIGTSHDTASFAVASIRRWWRAQGRRLYPRARRLLITADAGGSNGSRIRLWKWELQRLADETRIPISVCHFPPGTSKWNKIEHRLFSFISQNWRGEPLVNYETIVKLISATKTSTGLRVACKLDKRSYRTGRKITAREMETVKLVRDTFHGDWNYTILPRRKPR